MEGFRRLVGLRGRADGRLRAVSPPRRSHGWTSGVQRIGTGSVWLRVLAASALAVGGYLLLHRRAASAKNQPARPDPAASAASPADHGFILFAPTGLVRVAFRLPILVYRLQLGWLLGHRILMLTHCGRRMGHLHQTILEVVHYDPSTHESVVVSGWGERAGWYRNIQARPALEIQTGRERYRATFRILSADEAYDVMVAYERRLPGFVRPLARRLGFTVAGSEAVQRAHAAALLMVGFRPRPDEETRQTGFWRSL